MKGKQHPLRWAYAILGITILIATWAYDLPKWLTERPRSVHVWRQTDGASYALNYYQNDRPFLQPQVHHRFAKNGSTASEFPIIYFAAAQLYHWFGFHDYFIRWIGGLLLLMALMALLHLSATLIRDPIWIAFPGLMLLTSPLIVYYGPNFLPDVPAFSLAITGLWFFVQFIRHNQRRYYYLMLLCMTLAALLKISAAIYFVAILGCLMVQWWRANRPAPSIWRTGWTAIAVIIVAGWIGYVDYYNAVGGYTGNLQGTYGIWEADGPLRAFIWQRLWSLWRLSIGSVLFWLTTVACIVLAVWQYRHLPSWLKTLLPLVATGTVLYFLGWFKAFADHDYYLLPVFNLFLLLWLAGIAVLRRIIPSRWWRYSQLAAIAIVLFGIFHTRQRMHYRDTDPAWNTMPTQGYLEVQPYARSIGIHRKDWVYVHHVSTNIPLYFLNNPGFTNIYGMTAQKALSRGAKYVILHDTTLLNTPEFAPFRGKQIGAFKGIYFYRP